MPTEMRKVVFTNAEVLEAVRSYNAKAKEKLPTGEILSFKISVDNDVIAITIDISDDKSGKTLGVRLTESYIAAVLMSYCVDHKIPIPRAGDKSLQIIGDSIALSISLKRVSKRMFSISEKSE